MPLRSLGSLVALALLAGALPTSALLAAAPAPPPAAPSAEPWTWPRLMTAIERTHPLMKAAQADLGTFEARLSQAEWAIFPTFRLHGAATVTPEITGDALKSETSWDRPGYFLEVKLELVQPVWTFGKIGALKEAARRGVDVSRAQIEAARWELRVLAGRAWEGRRLARELEKILVDGRGWIDRAEQRMERLREEDSDEYDQLEHLRLKTRVAEFHVLDADNRMLETRSVQGLRILLSLAPGAPLDIADEPFEPVAFELRSADDYVALAYAHEPSLQVASQGIRAQEALTEVREAELWPDLVLVGEVGLRRANRIEDQPSTFANDAFNGRPAGLALALRWSLDIPQRLFRIDEARARAARTAHQADAQRDLIELRVRSLHQDLANKRTLLEVFEQSQRAAQGWLTATWDTYDAGFGNFRDVMDALVQFYGKKVGYLQLVFEHNLLVLELSRAVGYDIRELERSERPLGE